MGDRQVVIWSGGADSTLVLRHAAQKASEADPVIALTVEQHQNISAEQLQNQKRAQYNFLRHAEEKGLHIRQMCISISSENCNVEGNQTLAWLCAIAPYLQRDDLVFFGYIKTDEFWHERHLFEAAFRALCQWKGLVKDWKDAKGPQALYPLEWHTKIKVMRDLRDLQVPLNCIWTCESPRGGEPCGFCDKCLSMDAALKEMRDSARALIGISEKEEIKSVAKVRKKKPLPTHTLIKDPSRPRKAELPEGIEKVFLKEREKEEVEGSDSWWNKTWEDLRE